MERQESSVGDRRGGAASSGIPPIEDIRDPDQLALDLWGCIAVKCVLSSADKKDDDLQTHRCAFMVPRQGYLFFHLNTVKEKFARLVKAEQFIWFSADVSLPNGAKETVAIPWQYPVSVVFDILNSLDASTFSRVHPLHLTVHFTHDVSEGVSDKAYLKAWQVKADAREQELWRLYDQLLKQSISLRYGTTDPLERLRRDYSEHARNIFQGLKSCDGLQFHRGRMALLHVGDLAGTETHYPVVIHMKGKAQRYKVPPSKRTFGQMLHYLLQDTVPRFKSMSPDDWSSPVEADGVTVQGVSPMYNTPMEVVVDILGTVDLSLHVVVKEK